MTSDCGIAEAASNVSRYTHVYFTRGASDPEVDSREYELDPQDDITVHQLWQILNQIFRGASIAETVRLVVVNGELLHSHIPQHLRRHFKEINHEAAD